MRPREDKIKQKESSNKELLKIYDDYVQMN
jgi:hypothetical protein